MSEIFILQQKVSDTSGDIERYRVLEKSEDIDDLLCALEELVRQGVKPSRLMVVHVVDVDVQIDATIRG